MGRDRSQTFLGERDECTWPAFSDASAGSTSSRTSSLKRPSDPVLSVRYVVSANLVTVTIQYFCLVSRGNETKCCLGPGPEGTFNKVHGRSTLHV